MDSSLVPTCEGYNKSEMSDFQDLGTMLSHNSITRRKRRRRRKRREKVGVRGGERPSLLLGNLEFRTIPCFSGHAWDRGCGLDNTQRCLQSRSVQRKLHPVPCQRVSTWVSGVTWGPSKHGRSKVSLRTKIRPLWRNVTHSILPQPCKVNTMTTSTYKWETKAQEDEVT